MGRPGSRPVAGGGRHARRSRRPPVALPLVDVLATLGSPAQRARLFTGVLAGERLAGGQAERGGRHSQDLKTRLRPWPGGLRLFSRPPYAFAREKCLRIFARAAASAPRCDNDRCYGTGRGRLRDDHPPPGTGGDGRLRRGNARAWH